MTIRRAALPLLILALFGQTVGADSGTPAQNPNPPPRAAMATDEATLIAQGWMALAQGDLARAAQTVNTLRALTARSVPTLTLGVEVDLARSGLAAALDGYEAWLGSGTLEEPFVLRRIAKAALSEASAPASPAASRVSALMALADDGDQAALQALASSAGEGGLAELSALASKGNAGAVSRIIAVLPQMPGNRIVLIRALGESGSRQGVNILLSLLNDSRPEHQGAAAQALGRLDVRESIGRIRALMNDPASPPYLKIAAAGALAHMADQSGRDILNQALGSEVSGLRLIAAQALEGVRPDEQWIAVVRRLAQDPDPAISVEASRLVAPIDRELAQSTLERLAQDQNIAVREAASRLLSREVASDFRTLRRLLRSNDPEVRVGASARILELTR